MKIILSIAHILFSLFYFLILFCFTSCHSHGEGEDHSHGSSEAEPAGAHAHDHAVHAEDATTTSLTNAQMKVVDIQLGQLEQKQLTATLRANGFLKVPNNNKANATSLYSGVVKTINVTIGSSVRAGQVIATIANPDILRLQEEYISLLAFGTNTSDISTGMNNQYANLQMDKEALMPQIEYAKIELARQKELFEGNAGARKNLEMAQANLDELQGKLTMLNRQQGLYANSSTTSNQSRINSLKKQFMLMGIDPDAISPTNLKTVFPVTSPLSGTVSNLFAIIGSYVDVTSPVAEIVDNGSLHLDLDVFEKDLPKLKVGQVIHFTLTNNPIEEYDAKIFSIGNSFNSETKTIAIHCDVLGNKVGLIDGMNISAIVSLDNQTMPALPTSAIVDALGKSYIFIVTDSHEEAQDHDQEHSEVEAADHGGDHAHSTSDNEHKQTTNALKTEVKESSTHFRKVEVMKGISNMGYTAITLITDIPKDAMIATKGAFFINAKMTNQGEGHSH